MRRLRLLVRTGVFCLLVLMWMPAFTQNRQISGKVTDSTGAPITGASIIIEGTTSGATTDAFGSFRLTVRPQDKTVVISAVGYGTRRVSVNAGIFNVSLDRRAHV